MILKFHQDFKKSYEKLTPKHQEKVNKTLDIFTQNPWDRTLRNHALKGWARGQRAISVTGDMRIIFEEFEEYKMVLMLKVGTHAQVYRV